MSIHEKTNAWMIGILLIIWTLIAWALFPYMKSVFPIITPEIVGQYLFRIVIGGYVLIILFAIILGKEDMGARIVYRAKRFLKKGEPFPPVDQ